MNRNPSVLLAPVHVKIILFSDGKTLGGLIKGVDGYALLIEHVIVFSATPVKVVDADNAALNAALSKVVLAVSSFPSETNKSGITTKYSVLLVVSARSLKVEFEVIFVITIA